MKKKTKRLAAEVGAGVLTAAALAGAAAYFLSQTKAGKKSRAQAKAWIAKAKQEVVRNVRAARKMTQADYMRLADMAAKRYGSLEKASAPEILKAAREMKAEWKNIRNHAEKVAKGAQRSAKKLVRKPAPKKRSKR
jgi:hypothetical protein